MVSFRRKKDKTEVENLLASKKGLFGKKVGRSEDTKTDDEKKRRFKFRMPRSKKEKLLDDDFYDRVDIEYHCSNGATTPPVTPDLNETKQRHELRGEPSSPLPLAPSTTTNQSPYAKLVDEGEEQQIGTSPVGSVTVKTKSSSAGAATSPSADAVMMMAMEPTKLFYANNHHNHHLDANGIPESSLMDNGSSTTNTQQQQQLMDAGTVVSDLTYPQEMQQQLHQQQGHSFAHAGEPQQRGIIFYDTENDAQGRAIRQQLLASTAQKQADAAAGPPAAADQQQQGEESIVNQVLGLVDLSCFGPNPTASSVFPEPPACGPMRGRGADIEKTKSFLPEWGIKPAASALVQGEEDEDDDESALVVDRRNMQQQQQKQQRWTDDDTFEDQNTYDSTTLNTDGDTREVSTRESTTRGSTTARTRGSTTMTPSPPPQQVATAAARRVASPDPENFEMVLEANNANGEPQRPQNNARRAWFHNKNPGAGGGNVEDDDDAAVMGELDATILGMKDQQQLQRTNQRLPPPSHSPPTLKKKTADAKKSPDLSGRPPRPEARYHPSLEEEKKEERSVGTATSRSTPPNPIDVADVYKDLEEDEPEHVVKASKPKNPAAALIRKARRNNNNKKQTAASAGDGPKEKRYLNILKSLSAKEELATVEEGSEAGGGDNYLHRTASTEDVNVRVPGIQTEDAYLKASDLLGSELVEEEEQQADAGPVLSGSSPVIESRGLGASADGIPEISRSKSWREKLHLKRRGASGAKTEEPQNNKTGQSSNNNNKATESSPFSLKAAAAAFLPHATLSKKKEKKADNTTSSAALPKKNDAKLEPTSTEVVQEEPVEVEAGEPKAKGSTDGPRAKAGPSSLQKKKAHWKAVIDPKSGRTYYYHRITRETTWKRPAEEDIIPINPVMGTTTSDNHLIRKKNTDAGTSSAESGGNDDDEDNNNKKKEEEASNILSALEAKNSSSEADEPADSGIQNRLKAVNDARPFDEPVARVSSAPGRSSPSSSSVDRFSIAYSLDRSRTGATSMAGRTATSGLTGKYSDTTQQIKNTYKGKKKPGISAIMETESHATSISSRGLPRAPNSPSGSSAASLPSHVPVPRRRELMVEEFSSDGVKAQTYDSKRTRRGPRTLANWSRPIRPPQPPSPSPVTPDRKPATMNRTASDKPGVTRKKPAKHDTTAYLGDTEDADKDTASYSAVDDSISALSEPEHIPNNTRENPTIEAMRRRALNDAIAREDWDVAAALSDGMRSNKKQVNVKTDRREWTQSELDRFISDNDWDAVAGYIAHVRANSKAADNTRAAKEKTALENKNSRQKQKKPITVAETDSQASSPVKRFGARSQLQHSNLNSEESSWGSSTSYDSEYTSEDASMSVSEGTSFDRAKEFAC